MRISRLFGNDFKPAKEPEWPFKLGEVRIIEAQTPEWIREGHRFYQCYPNVWNLGVQNEFEL